MNKILVKPNPTKTVTIFQISEDDNPTCPSCDESIDGEWRCGVCDECGGSGHNDDDECCHECDGTGRPVCCQCRGTGVDLNQFENMKIKIVLEHEKGWIRTKDGLK